MSFLNTKYVKRVVVGKTIDDVVNTANKTTLVFTDGSRLEIVPRVSVNHTANSVTWYPKVIASAFDCDGNVIEAESFEEALDPVFEEEKADG